MIDRLKNRQEYYRQLVIKSGFSYREYEGKPHMVVYACCGRAIDFWTDTGKWIDDKGTQGRGPRNMFEHLSKIK